MNLLWILFLTCTELASKPRGNASSLETGQAVCEGAVVEGAGGTGGRGGAATTGTIFTFPVISASLVLASAVANSLWSDASSTLA